MRLIKKKNTFRANGHCTLGGSVVPMYPHLQGLQLLKEPSPVRHSGGPGPPLRLARIWVRVVRYHQNQQLRQVFLLFPPHLCLIIFFNSRTVGRQACVAADPASGTATTSLKYRRTLLRCLRNQHWGHGVVGIGRGLDGGVFGGVVRVAKMNLDTDLSLSPPQDHQRHTEVRTRSNRLLTSFWPIDRLLYSAHHSQSFPLTALHQLELSWYVPKTLHPHSVTSPEWASPSQ